MILRFGIFYIFHSLLGNRPVIQEMQTQAENHLHQMIGLK